MNFEQELSAVGIGPIDQTHNGRFMVGHLTADELDGWYRVELPFPAGTYSPPSQLLAARKPDSGSEIHTLYFRTPGFPHWSLSCGPKHHLVDWDEPTATQPTPAAAPENVLDSVAALQADDVDRMEYDDDMLNLSPQEFRAKYGTPDYSSPEEQQMIADHTAAGVDEYGESDTAGGLSPFGTAIHDSLLRVQSNPDGWYPFPSNGGDAANG